VHPVKGPRRVIRSAPVTTASPDWPARRGYSASLSCCTFGQSDPGGLRHANPARVGRGADVGDRGEVRCSKNRWPAHHRLVEQVRLGHRATPRRQHGARSPCGGPVLVRCIGAELLRYRPALHAGQRWRGTLGERTAPARRRRPRRGTCLPLGCGGSAVPAGFLA